MTTAKDFLSSRVVVVGPEQRLADVAEAVAKCDALYCAVVNRGGRFLGLIRLKDLVARSPERIFSDLLPASAPLDINEHLEAGLAANLLQSQGADELVVLSVTKRYVGLVTRESLFDWWLAEKKKQ